MVERVPSACQKFEMKLLFIFMIYKIIQMEIGVVDEPL